MEGPMMVGRVVIVVALTLGAPLVWLMLLNLRDRRQAALLSAVLDQISSRELRGRIGVQVRSGVLSGRSVVTVNLLAPSRNEIWEIMTRFARHLSPEVRLAVTGPVDRHFLATLTVRMTGRQPLFRPVLATS